MAQDKKLRVSTTGSNVEITDLGIVILHPTVNRDLSLEFTAIELRDSEGLTSSIQSGILSADDGTYSIHEDDYDPDELLIKELAINPDGLYTSRDELRSKGDILIVSGGIFPLTLNSTAQSTKNIYAVDGRFITWQLEEGDKVVIAGNAAAGTYTVSSVTDQQNFIVQESIVDSTGGTTNIYYPPAPERIGVDDTNFTLVSGDTLQETLEDIDTRLAGAAGGGLTVSEHSDLDTLLHNLNESHEIVPIFNDDGVIVSIESRESGAGDPIRGRASLSTDIDGLIIGYTVTGHDSGGSMVETMTATVTVSGSVPTVATLVRST